MLTQNILPIRLNTTDITQGKLESIIAENLGIPYFSKVTEGYICGLHRKAILPFVAYEKEARWGLFIIGSEFPWTYLSAQSIARPTRERTL